MQDLKEEENQNSSLVKEGEVLQIANNILSLLEYSQQLEDEEALFSDEFYISILSNLLTEQNYEINPGETPEEKVKSLKRLIKLLSEIIEMDLSQISAKGIIMEHDKTSAKSLLELIEELIKTLMNANLEEEESNNEENKKDNLKELKEEKNKSDNFRKIRERMNLDDDNENEENNEENENSSYKRKYAELEDGIDNLDDNFDEEEIKTEEKDKDKLMNIKYDLDDKNNESGSRVMNVSHISEMEKNKVQANSAKKKEIKEEKKSDSKNKNNNKKKYDDIPDLLIDKIKDDKKSEKNEEEKEFEEESIKYNNYLESNSNMGESNLYDEENFYVPQSVPRAYNVLNLSIPSKDSESSNHIIKSKKRTNKKKQKEKENSSNTNSNISFHSKNSKKNINKEKIDEYNNDLNISSTNKKIQISSDNKEESNNNQLKSKGNKSNKKENNKEENIEEEEDDISKSSEYSNAEKISKSSSSKKSNKSSKNKLEEKNIKNYNQIFFEIPMSEEEIKYTIKKELRKLYGEKASRYFKKNILEIIKQNLILARKEIIKYETGEEPDDFFSREFFQKYQKQMQQIIKNCIRELNKENLNKKNVILNIGNNVNFMKQLKDAENKEILRTIENKKKENESRNDEENMNNFNQLLMYPSYCYELQKQIYLTQTQNQIELNFAIEKEREKNIEESKKNYDNKIAILYEILRRQRRERKNKKKLGEILDFQLKNMKKKKLRQQVEDLLDQIDEENNKVNLLESNNGQELDKALKNVV